MMALIPNPDSELRQYADRERQVMLTATVIAL